MTPRLLLDEMISPALVAPCWEAGMDTVALRDRGKLGASDSLVWAMALDERRALVTINAPHFRPRALASSDHSGLVLVPSGGTRPEQLDYILAARKCAIRRNAFVPTFDGSIIIVAEDFTVEWGAEIAILAAEMPIQAQRAPI